MSKKYICKRTCFFQRLYRKGEIEIFADAISVPEHFELIEEIIKDSGSDLLGFSGTANGAGSGTGNGNGGNLPTGGGNVDEEELYLLLEDKTIAELKQYAEDQTIELGTATKKAEIIKLIVAAKVYGAKLTDNVPDGNTDGNPPEE